MALRQASLCLFIVLATFSSQCALGFSQTIGLIEYQYNAGDMTFQTEFSFLNGTFAYDAQVTLPQYRNFVEPVPEGVQVALTQFNMQKRFWELLSAYHDMVQCEFCRASIPVCSQLFLGS